MRILVDAMGGDNAPGSNVLGCINAIRKSEKLNISLIGDENIIKDILNKENFSNPRLSIVHASEVITCDEEPIKAIRNKKDSSIVVGLKMLKENKGDAFLSAGDTGVLLGGGKLIVKSIKGIDRPALPTLLPTKAGGTVLLLDSGLNTDCDTRNLYQFAKMGSMYMEEILEIKNPRVGLINIGTEERKGNSMTKKAYQEFLNCDLNFAGNIEGRDIMQGTVDVAVCDGFVGNIILKFLEGTASFLLANLKNIFYKNILNKIAAVILKKDLSEFFKKLDHEEVGGTLLFGIDGYIVKCHGSSTERAVMNGIFLCEKLVDSGLITKLRENFKNNIDSDVVI